MTAYNVFHIDPMGWMIAVYFFLSGIACGSFLLSVSWLLWGRGESGKVQKIGAVLAPVIMGCSFLFLLLDLGKPFRMINLFIYFNPSSVASWGVWLVNIFMLLALVYAWFVLGGKPDQARRFGIIGIPFALAVSGYTGMILMQMKGYALWNSALVPILFSVSAIASGIALVTIFSLLFKAEREQVQRMRKVLAWVVALDLVLVLVECLALLNGPKEAMEAARLLLIGAYSPLFLGLYIVAGLVIPLLLLARKKCASGAQAAASILILIGIMVMRYVIVIGGQYFPLS